MLLRSTAGRKRFESCLLATRSACRSTRTGPFSRTSHHQDQPIRSAHTDGESSEQRHGKQEQISRGSVRPFTVLALCIPLGYGANWALKHQDAGQVSQDGFVRYMLASKEEVSSTCSIFSLIPSFANTSIDTMAPELERSITSVQFKQPQLQIARSYTLLPPVEGQDEDELRFLIKREQKGEVSGYLHRLPLDAEVEVRGVNREYELPRDVGKVVFLAGGTGIAPALQVINKLRTDNADIHIFWANRKREDCAGGVGDTQGASGTTAWWRISRLWSNAPDCDDMSSISKSKEPKHPIVQELEDAKGIKSRSKLQVDYFVDEENSFIQPRQVSNLLREHAQGKKLLIVSGSDGFINYWAGPKQWLNGREVQGPIAGILGGMDTIGWEIVKL